MHSNNYTRVFLKRGEEREVRQGFPWIYDNEISHIKHFDANGNAKTVPLAECPVPDGNGCEVYTIGGAFLGTGILNRKSRMAVRLISKDSAKAVFSDTKAFWLERIKDAVNIRRLQYSNSDSYRLVFAEADLVPGFIADRFCDVSGKIVLVVQFLSLASEVFRDEILSALSKTAKPDGIYERDDTDIREKEGLKQCTGWIKGGGNTLITIEENGVKMEADIAHGQKTGYFLDQKANRMVAATYCHGKRVLDAFCNTGGFALCAAHAGAKEVVAVDIDEKCIEAVKHNATQNELDGVIKTRCCDVFDFLKECEDNGEKFDVIILDPPAFTKSARTIDKAYSGYKEINLRAMRLLQKSSILVTCSCSYFFDTRMFYDMLCHAASDSKRCVQVLEKRGAGADHPVLLGHERSEYLKCAIVRVI